MSLKPNNEIGEELTHDQLKTKQVYVLCGTHRPGSAFTAWYVGNSTGFAEFFCGENGRVHLLLRVDKGKFFDDLNHRIAVHEYLGDV